MSGGYFEYNQHRLEDIADGIDRLITTNNESDEYGYARNYSDKIIERFRETAYNLRRAAEMTQRVDWLVSGDDGEDTFHDRWAKEVRKPWKYKKK